PVASAPRTEASPELAPLDDADTHGAGPRRALVGGLALVAAVAAAYFLYPVASDMLRPAPSALTPPPTAATPTPVPAEAAPLATELVADAQPVGEVADTAAPAAEPPSEPSVSEQLATEAPASEPELIVAADFSDADFSDTDFSDNERPDTQLADAALAGTEASDI